MSYSNDSTNITTFTEEDFKHYLELKKQKENAAERSKRYNERRRVWMNLMVEKAKAADISVSDEEVEEVIKKLSAEK